MHYTMYDTKHSTMHNKHAQQACITCMRDISITPCTTCMLDNTTYAQHNKHLVLSIHTAPAAACMVPQVLQRSVAEEVEAVGIIVPAVHATHPEHAVARLQEGGFQALHLALPHLHLGVVPEEVAQLAQLLHLHTCHVYIDRHMDRHGHIHVKTFSYLYTNIAHAYGCMHGQPYEQQLPRVCALTVVHDDLSRSCTFRPRSLLFS